MLGRMSSLSLLVLGSRLRMRSHQICFRRSWDFRDESMMIPLDDSCQGDLQWWSDESNLTPGVPLESPMPDVHLYSDASDQGWGATIDDSQASSLWSDEERALSIDHRELLAVHLDLLSFRDNVRSQRVALFCDNTTVVSYLRKLGGTKSFSSMQ